MDWDINVLLSQDENLGYWWSTGFGFKSLSSFIFEWCDFRKNGLTENFCHKKESWKPLKTIQFCWLAVTKPFEQNLIMRHQWKEDIHIFHLIPCDTKYICYSGYTDHIYNQGPHRKWKNREWYHIPALSQSTAEAVLFFFSSTLWCQLEDTFQLGGIL